jgi:hypothetical protein
LLLVTLLALVFTQFRNDHGQLAAVAQGQTEFLKVILR